MIIFFTKGLWIQVMKTKSHFIFIFNLYILLLILRYFLNGTFYHWLSYTVSFWNWIKFHLGYF